VLSKHYEKGIKAYAQGHLNDAAKHLASHVAKFANHLDAWKVLGICYFDLGQYSQAANAFEKTVHLQPNDHETWGNLAVCHVKNQNFHQAIDCYAHCLELNPNNWKTLTGLGDTHKALNNIDVAISSYVAAINIRGMDAQDLLFKLSQVLLVNGAWDEGWELFESRLTLDTENRTHANLARWQGQALNNKHILVECEQGFGDSLQFARYLRLLQQMGAHITLACPLPLMHLFEHSFPDVKLIPPNAQISPDSIDFYVPMMSLAGLFKTRISDVPSQDHYLSTPPEYQSKWSWLGKLTDLKVGIVWSGNPSHKNDKNRSIAFEQLFNALPNHAHYFSIQKGEDIHHLKAPANLTVLGSEIENFADTAAICEHMDVVITVDTSIAHLCGALGIHTWVLLPYSPDWRWLLTRNDSVWYKSVRLFRQSDVDNWDVVLREIREHLLTLQHK
jgi:cytochrome c-type biogenesis protein CcmH/NrfG